MLLAYGQIPDLSRPSLSWPKYSLVGAIPQTVLLRGGGSSSKRKKKKEAERSLPKEIRQRLKYDSQWKAVEEPIKAIIIDPLGKKKVSEDEELMILLQAIVPCMEDSDA